MCRIGTLALVALVVSAADPHGATGQQTTDPPQRAPAADELESPEALRARIDSLRPLLERAWIDLEARNARAEEVDRVGAAARARVDTLHVGSLTVLTPTDQAATAEEIFQGVWDESYAHLGHSPALARSVVVFQWSDDRVPIHVEENVHRVELDAWTRRSRVEEAVSRTFAAAMVHDIGRARSRVGTWVQGNPLAPLPLERAYRMVATTRSRASRACLAGDTGACGSAMGLVERQDVGPLGARWVVARLGEWYTPEERLALVRANVSPRNRGRLGDARRRCVADSDIAVCDRVLTEYLRRDWTPYAPGVRETLVAYAIERGGPGAWERLAEDPDMTPIEAMEHASGVPMSELLSGWRARLVASRPDAYEHLIPRSGMTLVWTLIFAALAMRSTRWRLA